LWRLFLELLLSGFLMVSSIVLSLNLYGQPEVCKK
jgi:hypothetical protein